VSAGVAGAWVTNDDPPAGPAPTAKGFRAEIGPLFLLVFVPLSLTARRAA
jgi:hypothetical protein